MVQAVVAFAIWAANALAPIIGGYAAAYVVNFALVYAASAALTAAYAAIKGVPDFDDKIEALTVTTRETLAHQRIIYGETLVSGPIWYLNTTGADNRELHLGIVLAGHVVNSMSDVYLDGNLIPAAYIAATGGVTSGDYRGDTAFSTAAYFYSYNGSQTTVSSSLRSNFGTHISSKHIGHDIAWMHIRLDYFEGQTQVWSRGAPTNFKRLVRGKHVYDPRSDTTQSFGTGPLRVNSIPTWQWSENPALCWADYMIDSKLGFGEDYTRIDYGYVASAANICDGIVYTPVGTSRRFTCNGVLSTGDDHQTNIESLLSSFNGTVGLLNGTWKIRAFSYETPTLSLTDDMAANDVKIKLHDNEVERYNTVRGYFVDPDRLWQANQFPNFSASEYVARDDGKQLYRDIQLNMTKDIYMAQRLAAGILEQSDNQATVAFPGNYMVMPAEIGGTVMYTNEKMGWTDKVFRIQRYTFDEISGINLIMREDFSSAYTDVTTLEYVTPASKGGYTVNDPGVPAPSSFYTTNAPNGIYLTWTPPPARLYEYTEMYRATVRSFTNATLMGTSRIDNYLDRDINAGRYYYWLRAVNYTGEVSARVPDAAGVDSGGMEGLFYINTQLIYDSSFELTPINTEQSVTNEARFWGGVNSASGIGGQTDAFVVSDSVGTGGTNHLRMFKMSYPGSGGNGVNPYQLNYFPLVQGLNLHVNMKYRVKTYTNTSSAFIDIPIVGRKSYRDLTGGTLRTSQILLTNSTGWQVYSEELDVSTFLNVNSYTIGRFGLEINHFSTSPNTGSCEVDIDEVYLAFVP